MRVHDQRIILQIHRQVNERKILADRVDWLIRADRLLVTCQVSSSAKRKQGDKRSMENLSKCMI